MLKQTHMNESLWKQSKRSRGTCVHIAPCVPSELRRKVKFLRETMDTLFTQIEAHFQRFSRKGRVVECIEMIPYNEMFGLMVVWTLFLYFCAKNNADRCVYWNKCFAPLSVMVHKMSGWTLCISAANYFGIYGDKLPSQKDVMERCIVWKISFFFWPTPKALEQMLFGPPRNID